MPLYYSSITSYPYKVWWCYSAWIYISTNAPPMFTSCSPPKSSSTHFRPVVGVSAHRLRWYVGFIWRITHVWSHTHSALHPLQLSLEERSISFHLSKKDDWSFWCRSRARLRDPVSLRSNCKDQAQSGRVYTAQRTRWIYLRSNFHRWSTFF